MHYNYLELGGAGEAVQEGDPHFQSALTAHPVRDPVQMYKLHKAFTRAELERTYQEIQELQVRAQRPWVESRWEEEGIRDSGNLPVMP